MARPRRVSDDQILATTKACVLEHGSAVSLDAIAGELGVTAPALLKRFGTRRTLLVKALTPSSAPNWVQALATGPDHRPLEAQLEAIFQGVSAFMSDSIPCMSALRESGIDLVEVHRLRKGQTGPLIGIRALAAWLTSARARGLVQCDDPETAATAMLGAVMARLTLGHLYQEHWSPRSQRGYLHEMVRLFARALAGAAAAPPSTPPMKRAPA